MTIEELLKYNGVLREWGGDAASLWPDICVALYLNGAMDINALAEAINRTDRTASLYQSLKMNRCGKLKNFCGVVTSSAAFEPRFHLMWDLTDKGRAFVENLLKC